LKPVVEKLIGSLIGLAAALAAMALAFSLLGYNPAEAFRLLGEGIVENYDIMLLRVAPLILTSLAFAVPAFAGLFNIGGEGQAYVGALAALAVSYIAPNPVLCLLVGALAGGLLGYLAGVLRVKRGVHEVVSTIMLNWIAFYTVRYIVVNYFKNPYYPDTTNPVPPPGRLGQVAGVPVVVFIAIAACILCYLVLYRMPLGLAIRSTGAGYEAARRLGIDVEKAMILSMLLGGVFGGLAGAVIVIGETYNLDVALSSVYGVGFDGIGAALLAWNNPLAIPFSSLLLSALVAGGYQLQIGMGIDIHVLSIFTGVVVFVLGLPSLYELLKPKLQALRLAKARRRGGGA